MKKLFTILFLFVSFIALSQNNGINFQGVGRNSSGAVLASTKISLRFSVIQSSETGTVEYVESKEVTTNAQGIFSVVIGDETQISKTGNFSDINWKINPKFLKVEMDPAGGTSFVAMGTTRLQSVPFAYYANGVNADNVDGILSASKGGTGVASISALKTALAIDQINNTSDLAKPISTSTQAALDTKVSTTTFSTTIAAKASIDSPTFTGTVAGITKAMVGLGSVNNTSDLEKPISTLTQEALDTKVSTATFSTTVATKANVTDLALKAPIESPTFTGTVAGITKAMVGLGSVNNTTDLAKPISTATQEALDTKVSASTFSTTLATKVSTETFSSTVATKENAANKSTATDLGGSTTSDILFPTQKAVKTYVDAQVNAGGVADGGITTNKLAAGAVTDEKVASGINKTKVGLGNVDNTADLDKPLSNATILALADKPSIDVRRVAKLDESNSFTGDQQISGNLSLSNGILNLAGGTQIQSGNSTSTIFQNITNEDFSIITNDGTNHQFNFAKDGFLRYNDGSEIGIDSNSGNFKITADNNIVLNNNFEFAIGGDFILKGQTTEGFIRVASIGGSPEFLNLSHEEFIVLGNPMTANTWGFNVDSGDLYFPDYTIASGNVEGTNNFGFITEEKGFMIETSNGSDSFDWIFDKDGFLSFPDGTIASGNYSGTSNFAFDTRANESGFSILTGIPNSEPYTWTFSKYGDIYFPDGTELNGNASGTGNFGFTLAENKGFTINTYDGRNEFNWKFKETGILEFPDGTTLAGNYSGSTYFDLTTYDSDGFKITTNGPQINTWKFYQEGTLTFPDGTITSGSISGTSNFGFDTRATENGFSIITAGTSSGTTQLWEYNTDGSLTFPDGTITSGNISGTSNFGFDTRPTENGFTILTGTSSGTSQLWTFGTDGNLTLPQGGEIKDQNGNSVLMRFLSIEHIPDQNTIDAINAITDGNNQPRNTLEQNNGVINGYTITLNHLPISIDHVALYLNGVRVYKSQYSLSNGQIVYYANRRQNQNDINYLEMMLSNDDIITIDYFY